jgi:hypothetical protein
VATAIRLSAVTVCQSTFMVGALHVGCVKRTISGVLWCVARTLLQHFGSFGAELLGDLGGFGLRHCSHDRLGIAGADQ